MAKRKSHGGDGSHVGKKQKIRHVHEPPTSEEVHTSRQLLQLLTFEQDLRKARHGLQSFKLLLDSVVNDEPAGSEKSKIVLEYLEAVKPKDRENEVPVYLPDLMDTWSMASEMSNENVMSAVPIVLALLLKILSGDVSLVPYGLGICRTLLQKRQQELLAKNLSAEKGKDFIISPTLRLLKEIMCLDGGALALPIFRARNNTFKSMARNMDLQHVGDKAEDPKRPSVRTNAVRFFLSALRLLYVEARKELLTQRDMVAALMRHLKEDPPVLVHEILNVLKDSVVLDRKLPKDVKVRILNAQSLIRVASLYRYSHHTADSSSTETETTEIRGHTVEQDAHDLLVAACTDFTAGLCREDHGYYPEGIDLDTFTLGVDDDDHTIDLSIDSLPWMTNYEDEVPVRNSLLAEFIQSLRPWSSTKQNDLLVAIFDSCPELIANYFARRKTFTFDPKLSATWMGYAALLYNAVKLPIPAYFGHPKSFARLPPPTSVVMGNLLPQPVTLKALRGCLQSKSKLVSFYAIRIMILAMQKLGKALEMYREASSASSIWDDGARRLVDEFSQNIPTLQAVITCYRTMTDDDSLQREAISRLILLYYETLPQLALNASPDVSALIFATIKKVEANESPGEDMALSLLELEHLCIIAKYSPGMRWFAQTSELPTSPFATLLRLYVRKTTDLSNESLGRVLSSVAEEYQLVESRANFSGLDPLVAALKAVGNVDPDIWKFLDHCFERCAKRPLQYLELIEDILEKAALDPDANPITCPLMMAIGEQISFYVPSTPDDNVFRVLIRFLSLYLKCSLSAGLSKAFLQGSRASFVVGIIKGFDDPGSGPSLPFCKELDVFDTPQSRPDDSHSNLHSSSNFEKPFVSNGANEIVQQQPLEIFTHELEERLSVSISMSKENILMRWSSKTPEELVEEGYAASLIGLLASDHSSIRKEALTNIIKMASKIKESSYEENEQVWLLLMELAESAKDTIMTEPLPSSIVSFASRGLDVLKNPLHCLYEKVNLFLTGSPVWALDKIPLLQHIVQEGPTEDSAYYSEVSWLLSFLLDSLRTPEDVAIFHKRRVFEKIFALSCNPYMGPNLRTQVLRIVYRTSSIEGGSDTLITRFGAMTWLAAQKAAVMDEAERTLYQALMKRLWDTCDQRRISEWSKGGIEKMITQ